MATKAKSTKKATKVTAKKATTQNAKPVKAKTPKTGKRLSQLDAAAQVLAEANEPLAAKAMIEAMATKGLWTSPNGKTPASTLYAAIIREIATKGDAARFRKTDRGLFTVATAAAAKAKPAAKAKGKAAAKKAKPADETPGPKSVSDLLQI